MPTYASMSGFYLEYQLHPLIPAKAGIQEIIHQPQQGPSLDPGLRRGERCLGRFTILSAHTGEGRYPGDHLQTLAGPPLDPGLRRGERLKGA